ncbi:hypothetical protein [Paenibacillus sp. QZ-Y1]|uniref:hypothetical protein n=1 Tax=Paenibacillus sp. QZ-Y1 TaxID=3414511 RepID=UPI003F7ADAA5
MVPLKLLFTIAAGESLDWINSKEGFTQGMSTGGYLLFNGVVAIIALMGMYGDQLVQTRTILFIYLIELTGRLVERGVVYYL